MVQKDSLLSLRLPQHLLQRLEAVIPHLQNDPRLAAASGGKISRSAALRLAIVEGVEVLERLYGSDLNRQLSEGPAAGHKRRKER